jgi:hypothetical protein|tara:strand:+ start:1011 stop:1958 length:948 start_codon:yes stop_codon:yes gene_type:complete
MEKQNLYIFNFSIFLLKIITITMIIGFAFNFAFEKLVIFESQINGASKVNRILSKTEKNEIPIFGSSRAEGNFVPSIIEGENCFNYGISGTQANIWLFFLEQELKKQKHTPIIINFDLGGLNYSDGNIGNYIPNWSSTKNILTNKGEFYYEIPFIKYYGQYERYFKFYMNEKINLTKVTDNGGSFEKNKLTTSKFNELVHKRENTKSSFKLNKQLSAKFNKLITSTSRSIVLVVSPYHVSYFNQFENIEMANKYLSSLSERENIRIIDLRNYIIDDNMFLDTSHLNYEGAIKFTRRMKEELLTTKYKNNSRNSGK